MNKTIEILELENGNKLFGIIENKEIKNGVIYYKNGNIFKGLFKNMILINGEKKYPNSVKQIGQFENTNLKNGIITYTVDNILNKIEITNYEILKISITKLNQTLIREFENRKLKKIIIKKSDEVRYEYQSELIKNKFLLNTNLDKYSWIFFSGVIRKGIIQLGVFQNNKIIKGDIIDNDCNILHGEFKDDILITGEKIKSNSFIEKYKNFRKININENPIDDDSENENNQNESMNSFRLYKKRNLNKI